MLPSTILEFPRAVLLCLVTRSLTLCSESNWFRPFLSNVVGPGLH